MDVGRARLDAPPSMASGRSEQRHTLPMSIFCFSMFLNEQDSLAGMIAYLTTREKEN